MRELVLALSSEILLMAGLVASFDMAVAMLEERLADGSALARFGRLVAALGGPGDIVERPDAHLAIAPLRLPVAAGAEGFVQRVDAYAVGLAMVGLGAGRRLPTDTIDHGVGLSGMVHVGDRVEAGDPLCILHLRDPAQFDAAAAAIRTAVTIGAGVPTARPVVGGRLSTSDGET